VPVGRPLISLDGNTLASRTSVGNRRSDDSLRVWNIATRQLQCRAPWTAPGIDTYEEMALSGDGSRAVIPVRERDVGEQGVEIWDVRTCRNLGVLEHNAEPPAVEFVLTPASGLRYLRHVGRIAISPSGRYVSWATNGNDLHVWDTVQKRFTFTTRVPVPAVVSTRQGLDRISNQLRRGGQPVPLPANLAAIDALLGYDQVPEGIVELNFGSNDSQLATLDADGLVRLWDPDPENSAPSSASSPLRAPRSCSTTSFRTLTVLASLPSARTAAPAWRCSPSATIRYCGT
jgi:WD40 repeat protein